MYAKHTVRKHWKLSAVFTGSLHSSYGKRVDESDLLPGELSAEIFRVGCYAVRSAQRVYRVYEPGYSPEEEIPAGSEDVELVRKDIAPIHADPRASFTAAAGLGLQPWRSRLRVTHEISARHRDNPNGIFTVICRAAQSRNLTWSERIGPVYAAKEHLLIPDRQASLFVCNTYVGGSFSADTWYKFDPDGKISTLSLHPYDSDIGKARFA